MLPIKHKSIVWNDRKKRKLSIFNKEQYSPLESLNDLKKNWDDILSDCSDWFELAHKQNNWKIVCLYYGSPSYEPYVKKYNKNHTHNTLLDEHDQYIVDIWFAKNKYKAMSSNSLVVNGLQSEARKEGYIYYYIPCNNFNFTWSENIFSISKNLYDTFGGKENFHKLFKNLKQRREYIENFLTNNEYIDRKFNTAIASHHEIYIHGDHWLVIKNKLTTSLFDGYFKEDHSQ